MKPFFPSLLLLLSLATAAFAKDTVGKAAAPPDPITAQAYFLLDVDTGRVLAQKNANQQLFPASTTKMMTCLVAVENAPLNKIITVSQRAANTGESGIGVLAGEQFTLSDLIQAALIKSANDACVAIAEGVGGSQDAFVKMMNAKAKELGCRNTHFMNPHGLHDPNHYTTAHDLAVIGKALLREPYLDRVVREKTAVIHGNWKIGPTRLLINRNKLLFRWPACDGLKTGYTRQAGNTLVASATMPDPETQRPWRLLGVVMKCGGGRSWPDCQHLIEQEGFQVYRPQTVVKANEVLHTGLIPGGAIELQAVTPSETRLPMRGRERETLQRRVNMFQMTAPVQQGQPVGHVEYFAEAGGQRRRIADLPLVALNTVPQTVLARAFPSVGNHMALLSPTARLAIYGVLCLGAAFLLLLFRGNAHARRRSKRRRKHPFEPAHL